MSRKTGRKGFESAKLYLTSGNKSGILKAASLISTPDEYPSDSQFSDEYVVYYQPDYLYAMQSMEEKENQGWSRWQPIATISMTVSRKVN
jgi:hypothetical protein